MIKKPTEPKPACDLVRPHCRLGLKAVLATALQITTRRRRPDVPNA